MLAAFPHITKLIGIITVSMLMTHGVSDPERRTKVRVAGDSEVVISGTTNVNQFTCRYNLEEMELPIRLVYDDKKEHILFNNASLQLANDCFDCGGRAINKDFKELLQTESHPQVEMKLLYVDPPQKENSKVGVGMEIIIAGVSRRYNAVLDCNVDNKISVNGVLELKLSDFNLQPPKKMMGMIKVDDEIMVRLAIKMSEV
ncbi:YceI family protein [Flagellimonas sp. GZD32]|uniref:YceI family protein n=1 Tax=Flagellimonas cixiensis TaxID=3228750 RepID=UPI0035C8BB3C